ncbi:MAG TPA: site-2 protease family protein [Opitutaceae bacterium]|nr:site-2 protease family protein [Opitutaceae bacterium]
MDFRDGTLFFIILVSSLCIHEWAHAWTAWKLGDDTAHAQGRVTLNPLPHIDLLGTIIFPLLCIFLLNGSFLFGWAKPVPVNIARFKNPRSDDALTTFAGPFSNLLLAIGVAALGGLATRYHPVFAELTMKTILVNITLFVFNLLPVPPLDGGRLLRVAIGMTWETFASISRWSMLALIVALNVFPAFSGALGALMMMLARPLLFLAAMAAGL